MSKTKTETETETELIQEVDGMFQLPIDGGILLTFDSVEVNPDSDEARLIIDGAVTTVIDIGYIPDLLVDEFQSIATSRYTDETWMREQYLSELKSESEIANMCSTEPTIIRNWLEKHDIRPRTKRSDPEPDTDPDPNPKIIEVEAKPEPEPNPVMKAADLLDPAELIEYPKWLRHQYITQDKSETEIAELCGCLPKTIIRWLENHEIELKVDRTDTTNETATETQPETDDE